MIKTKVILLLILSCLVPKAIAEGLHNLSPQQLLAMQKNNHALVVDIRTNKEWGQTGIIPNSHKLQFYSPQGNYDTEKWLSNLNQLKTFADQPIILVCRSGGRSSTVGNLLAKKLKMKNIYHLSNGILPWIKAGNNITKDCPTELACK